MAPSPMSCGVRSEFDWLPAPFVWLYAYSYFNALNLENMFTFSGAPLFDGSRWQNLLPSFLRPTAEASVYVEIDALNVSSFVYPIYIDVGPIGTLIWTAVWGLVMVRAAATAARARIRAIRGRRGIWRGGRPERQPMRARFCTTRCPTVSVEWAF